MKKLTPLRVLRITHLFVCGAIIGLYAAKAFGLFGVEITQLQETAGAAVGASAVAVLKVASHFHLA